MCYGKKGGFSEEITMNPGLFIVFKLRSMRECLFVIKIADGLKAGDMDLFFNMTDFVFAKIISVNENSEGVLSYSIVRNGAQGFSIQDRLFIIELRSISVIKMFFKGRDRESGPIIIEDLLKINPLTVFYETGKTQRFSTLILKLCSLIEAGASPKIEMVQSPF